MAAYGGIGGSVRLTAGGTCMGDIKSWSADIQWASEDTTAFDCAGANGYWGQNALTMRSISGSIEMNFNAGNAEQVKLINEFFTTGDGAADLHLYPYNGTIYLKVPALLTGFSINSVASGIVTATCSFVQSGATAPTFVTT